MHAFPLYQQLQRAGRRLTPHRRATGPAEVPALNGGAP